MCKWVRKLVVRKYLLYISYSSMYLEDLNQQIYYYKIFLYCNAPP